MGKEVKPLPMTKAETAEKRLEELIRKKLVKAYYTHPNYFSIKDSECRTYPDGFEAILKDQHYGVKGMLHLCCKNSVVIYNVKKEQEEEIKTA